MAKDHDQSSARLWHERSLNARRLDRWPLLLAALILLCATTLFAHESGKPVDTATAEQHILDDAYWAELAQDYPPFRKNESSLHAPVLSPTDKDELGDWGPIISWPHTPVSAANLPDGRILTWASNHRHGFPPNFPEFTYTATWDPVTGIIQEIDYDGHDMFCAHQVVLDDGRVFVTGGRNHVTMTSVFDATTDTWTKIDDMNNGRWYPTAVAIPDGNVFVAIGSSGGRFPELWSPGQGWLTLGGIDLQSPILDFTSYAEQNWWPYLSVAPAGDIVHYGPTPEMHSITVAGNGSISPLGPHNADWYPKHAGVVMYDEGKILVAGGWIGGGNQFSSNKSMVVDINTPTPTVTPIAPMNFPRKFANAVVLPTGEVLMVGGNASGTKFGDAGSILAAEIWNPDTQLWREVADMDVPRNYHSVALLLTDGTVLSAGGGLCGSTCAADHPDAQIYSPPYLFNPDGSLAPRPNIAVAPTEVGINATFAVQATPNIAKFALIKMSSTTHAVNTDLRYVEVMFTETGGGNYQLTTHSNSNVLTPGHYMLFAIDPQGVPSESSVVRVVDGGGSPDTTPPTDPSNLVATTVSSSQIDLIFTGSTDAGGAGLAGYNIYRDGALVALTAATNYSDSGLNANTSYSYQVSAIDGAVPPNESGLSNLAIATTFQATNQAPLVSAGADTGAETGITTTLTGSVGDDGLPNPPGNVTQLWTAVSGPGTPTWPLNDADQAVSNPVFPVSGSYVLRLTADDGELTAFDEVTVTVTDSPNQQPTAAFTATPSAGLAPLTVNFDASGSIDPDGTIDNYAWDFGDGGSDVGMLVSHEFSAVGDYTVTLTVTDNQGGTDTANTTISASGGGSWWNPSWSQQKKLEFDNSGIAENLSNFPVLVSLTPSTVDYGLMQANGEDLRFIDSDNATVLAHEIGTWNPGGTSTVWVNVPQIDANSTTDHVWLYYGNAAATNNQNPAAVWSGYAAVWHLDGNENDSTANANHGTNVGALQTTGLIGEARQFDGSSSYIDAGNGPSLAVANTMTIEAWIKIENQNEFVWQRLISKKSPWNALSGYELDYNPSWNRLSVLAQSDSFGYGKNNLDTGWHHIAVVLNGTNVTTYFDTIDDTFDNSIHGLIGGTENLFIGQHAGGGNNFNGMLDEVRIAPTAYSPDWLAAQYRSTSGNFVTISNGGPGGGNVPPTVSLTAPGEGTSYTEPADIILTANSSDSDGSVTSVDFYAGATFLGTDTANPYNIVWGSAPAGNYALTAVATDDGGATAISGVTNITVQSLQPLVVNPMTSPPQLEATPVTYTAIASGSANLQYSWNFSDGTGDTPASSSPTVNHSFGNAGRYVVTLTVTGSDSQTEIIQFWQAIYEPWSADRPSTSMSVLYEERSGNDRLWNVNPDNDTVSAFDTVTHAKITEIAVGNQPRSLAIAPDGRIWVTNNEGASVSIIDTASLSVVQTVSLANGSEPFGIVFDAAGVLAYVALEGTGELLRLDATTGAIVGALNVGPNPRHLSISGDGNNTVLVPRFVTPPLPGEGSGVPNTEQGGNQIGAEVLVVDNNGTSVTKTIVLRHSDNADSEHAARGIPNYLGPAAISPSGSSAWVPSKQDNIKRGVFRDGQELTHDSTVRAITSRIDLNTETEDYPARLDHDDGAMPSTSVFGHYGSYLFTALEGSQEIAIIEPYGEQELLRFDTGRATQGIAISPDGLTLYAHNFMDRQVTVHDLSNVVNEGGFSVTQTNTYDTVASETLSAQVLNGKQLFYDAKDQRLSLQSYMSCASCHNDGQQDGRVWDLTGFGEGLRNTVRLEGRGGPEHGPLHWTANFDEVQDFEGQIRALSGGTGLMDDADFNSGTTSQPLGDPKAGLSPDLDALAAYVNSLEIYSESPFRNGDGTLTADGLSGLAVFETEACATCHKGSAFSDSGDGVMHDIGTITGASGSRLGGPLTELDTPALRDVWATGPYLHDGSAATLSDAVNAHQGVALSSGDLALLEEYLLQIDANEPPPVDPVPPNVPPAVSLSAPTEGAGFTLPVDVPIDATASDSDGNVTSVAFYAGATLLGTDTVSPYSVVWSNPPVGNHALTAVATDDDGDSTTSFAINIDVQPAPPANQAPAVSLNAPTEGASFTLPVDVPIDATASDSDGNVTSVAFYAGATLLGTDTVSPYSVVWSNPPVGNHALTAVATDDDGDSTTSFAVNIDVQPAPPANQAPAVSLNAPTEGASFTLPVDVPIDATASDSDGNVTSVAFYAGATLLGTDTVSPYSVVWSNPPVGNHALTAVATDDDGDSTTSFAVNIDVQPAPPTNQAPLVSAGADTGAETGITTTLTGSVGDDGLPNPPGNVTQLWTAVSGPGTPTWPLNDADQAVSNPVFPVSGSYVLRLTADDGELTAFDEVTVTVTDSPNQQPTAAFTATPSAGLAPLTVNFDASGSIDPDGTIDNYAWDFGDGGSDVGMLVSHEFSAVGDYTVTLTVTDNQGGTDTANTTISASGGGSWWNPSWSQQKKLEFDNSGIAENLSNFPVLVSLTPSTVDYGLMQANGEDLRFIDSDNATVLAHEIGTWNPGGTSTVWVNVPQIDANSTTDHVWLYYGNAAATNNQNPAAVWSGYAAVWHLDGNENDSTANANHGTNVGALQTTGLIGEARQFDGSSSYIDAGNGPSLAVANTMTIEAWIKIENQNEFVWQRLISKKSPWNALSGYELDYNPSWNRLSVLAQSDSFGYGKNNLDTGWHHIAVVLNGTNVTTYFDTIDDTFDNSIHGLIGGTENLFIGQHAGGGNNFNGMLDEVRIAPTAYSPDWLAAQYRSTSGNFVTIIN